MAGIQLRARAAIDPYRLLFPIGYLLAAFGAALWILFYSGTLASYPLNVHASSMMSGFQFVIAAGFLMTAIPRFTGTRRASSAELAFSLTFGLLLLFTSIAAAVSPLAIQLFFWTAFVFSVFLAYYAFDRFKQRTRNPPDSFSFVGLALLLSIMGNAILVLSKNLPATWILLARLFLYHGIMLSIVLGMGSLLVTSNLGWKQEKRLKTTIALTAVFGISFFIEAFSWATAGRVTRAVIASLVILPTWRLYRRPKAETKMAFRLWLASWFVLAGTWVYALAPPVWAIAGAHLMFIGGFSLMIFLLGSRMILSSGGHDLSFELRSRTYPLIISTTLAAALLRLSASLYSAWTVTLIVAAACLFLVALAIWGYAFLGKAIRGKTIPSG